MKNLSLKLIVLLGIAGSIGFICFSLYTDRFLEHDLARNVELAYNAEQYTQAYRMARFLSILGSTKAQFYLAMCYQNGFGTPQDFGQAFQWQLKAANRGFKLSQKHVGMMYEAGIGVKKNYVEAYQWYSLAATGLSAPAQVFYYMEKLKTLMSPVELAEARKRIEDYKSTHPAK